VQVGPLPCLLEEAKVNVGEPPKHIGKLSLDVSAISESSAPCPGRFGKIRGHRKGVPG
jgi:hypothetical protein